MRCQLGNAIIDQKEKPAFNMRPVSLFGLLSTPPTSGVFCFRCFEYGRYDLQPHPCLIAYSSWIHSLPDGSAFDVWGVRLAAQDTALSRRRSGVQIPYALPNIRRTKRPPVATGGLFCLLDYSIEVAVDSLMLIRLP